MDDLGIASEVVGIISLTVQLVQISRQYIQSVRDSPRNIHQYLGELQDLETILRMLQDQAEAHENKIKHPILLSMETSAYEAAIRRLIEKLRKRLEGGKLRKAFTGLTWPFAEEEVVDIIAMLHRYRSIFQSSLAIENSETLNRIERSVHAFQSAALEHEMSMALNQISPRNPQDKQFDVFSRHQPDTGNWLLSCAEFQSWQDTLNPSSTLWCVGIPGSGKTVLASIIIDHLQRRCSVSNIGLAYVFCDYERSKLENDQTAATLVAALLRTLVSSLKHLPEPVSTLSKRCQREGRHPQLAEALQALYAVSTQFKTIYIVVDALDECAGPEHQEEFSNKTNERKPFLAALRAFQQHRPKSIRLLVTSRPNAIDIHEFFKDSPHLNIVASTDDVKLYLQGQLETNDEDLGLIVAQNATLKHEIISTIAEQVHGM
jgi:hypothetical protein